MLAFKEKATIWCFPEKFNREGCFTQPDILTWKNLKGNLQSASRLPNQPVLHHEVLQHSSVEFLSTSNFVPISQYVKGFEPFDMENATSKKPEDAEEKIAFHVRFRTSQRARQSVRFKETLEPKSKLWSLNVTLSRQSMSPSKISRSHYSEYRQPPDVQSILSINRLPKVKFIVFLIRSCYSLIRFFRRSNKLSSLSPQANSLF